MTIGLLGATGYTGRLVAAELARRGLPHKLGARSESHLARVPVAAAQRRSLVDAGDPASLDAFLAGVDVLVTTVGPFARLGMPVVEAAVRNGVAYVDAAGETGFIRDVHARYAGAPVPVVPACGFDCVPGDLAAAVAAADLGVPAERVTVSYETRGFRPSRGTARSALDQIAGMPVETTVARFARGERPGLVVPLGESLLVPRHVPGAEVRVVVALPSVPAPLVRPVVRLAGAAMPLLRPVADRLPEGPSERSRSRSRFSIVAEAAAGSRRTAVQVRGRDAYGLTAVLLVEAALRVTGKGALAPAQALGDPAEFLDAVSGDLLSWRRL